MKRLLAECPPSCISIGRLGRPFSVKGWVWFHDYGDSFLHFRSGLSCFLQKGDNQVVLETTIHSFFEQSSRVRLLFSAFLNRSDAQSWVNADLIIRRSDFSPLSDGEYYWIDLIGLCVENKQGVSLGVVHRIVRTVAHDLIDVRSAETSVLIPAIEPFICFVDQENKRMIVDWVDDGV